MPDSSSNIATKPERRVPAVVVVSSVRAVFEVCKQAMQYVSAANVELSDLAGANTAVAKWRPFALVVDRDLYAFDPGEFDALARDVQAAVVIVEDPSESRDQLLAYVLPHLRRAYRLGEARYSGA